MAESNSGEDTKLKCLKTELSRVQDSDIIKVTGGVVVKKERDLLTDEAVVKEEHGLMTDEVVVKEELELMTDEIAVKEERESERDETGIEHMKGERKSGKQRKRAASEKFKSDKLISESKSLLIKNAMHEEASDEDKAWLASLSDVEVDMLISIKKMAMERAKTIQDERVSGIFTSRVLRTIGLLLKEFIKERLKNVDFLAKATEMQNIQPSKYESRSSPRREEKCNQIIPQDIVGEVFKEMIAGQNRKRKRYAHCNNEDIKPDK